MAMTRPLTGEPLGVDLLNTTWRSGTGPVDVLDDIAGTRDWLLEAGIAGPTTEPVREALIRARAAIRAHAEAPDSEPAIAALNEVLRWGRSWPAVSATGPVVERAVEDPARWAGWLAAVDYTEQVAAHPGRIRSCAHPDCVLWFVDTSARGTRRWCSMAGCGNRAKAARHYARSRPGEE
jgi:predicted RNA-binding Zn ribbon-like protein